MTISARFIAVLAIAAGIAASGCSSDGGPSLTPEARQIQGCLDGGFTNLLGLFTGLDSLLAVAGDSSLAEGLGIVYDPVSGEANTWDYEADLDLDRDGTDDAGIAGRISFSADPDGGPDPGTTASLTWSLSDLGAGVSGSGSFALTFLGDGSVDVSGTGTLVGSSGDCRFDYAIPANDPLNVRLPGSALTACLRLADTGTGLALAGGVDVGLQMGGDTASARAVFTQGTNVVSVVSVVFTGVSLPDFAFSIAALQPFLSPPPAAGWDVRPAGERPAGRERAARACLALQQRSGATQLHPCCLQPRRAG